MARGADALVQFQQALTLAEKMRSRSQQGRVLRNMARTEIELGDLDAAARAIDRGLALAGSDGDTTARAQFLGLSAPLAQRQGARKSVVSGKGVAVRVEVGGGRIIKK